MPEFEGCYLLTDGHVDIKASLAGGALKLALKDETGSITREAASQLSDNPTPGASVEPSATSSAALSADSSTSPEAGEPTGGVRASDSDAGVAGAGGVATDPALKPTQQPLAGVPSRSAGSLPGSEAQQAVSGQQSSSGGGGLASTGASVLGIADAGALALGRAS